MKRNKYMCYWTVIACIMKRNTLICITYCLLSHHAEDHFGFSSRLDSFLSFSMNFPSSLYAILAVGRTAGSSFQQALTKFQWRSSEISVGLSGCFSRSKERGDEELYRESELAQGISAVKTYHNELGLLICSIIRKAYLIEDTTKGVHIALWGWFQIRIFETFGRLPSPWSGRLSCQPCYSVRKMGDAEVTQKGIVSLHKYIVLEYGQLLIKHVFR